MTIHETTGGIRKDPMLRPVTHKAFARTLSLSGNQFATALVPAGNIGA